MHSQFQEKIFYSKEVLKWTSSIPQIDIAKRYFRSLVGGPPILEEIWLQNYFFLDFKWIIYYNASLIKEVSFMKNFQCILVTIFLHLLYTGITFAQNSSLMERLEAERRLYTDACNKEYLLECVYLGDLEYEQNNIDRAKEYYGKACDGKYAPGCFYLGNIEYTRGNVELAKTYYGEACNGGDMSACSNRGVIEYEQENIATAEMYFIRAYEGGSPQGSFNLGLIEYLRGNISNAEKLFKEACEVDLSMNGCGRFGF